MGRRTYEVALTRLNFLHSMGKQIVVVSTTLDPAKHPEATILAKNIPDTVAKLKEQPGKDIWLMGGGALFRGLLDACLVDSVEVALSPVLLGGGVPLIPAGRRHTLHFVESKILPSGVHTLSYRTGP